MKVIIKLGFEREATEAEQRISLNALKETLIGFQLPVSDISSERKTGGPISLEIPEEMELHEITRSLASFAEALACQNQRDVHFDIEVPKHGFEVTIAGAA